MTHPKQNRKKFIWLAINCMAVVVVVLTGVLLRGFLMKKTIPASIVPSCVALENSDACWKQRIKETLAKEGLEKALDLMQHLYESKSAFAAGCHGYTHTLGYDAYGLYMRHQPIVLSAKASMCSFGFYHGFMELLLAKTHSPTQARDFCIEAGKTVHMHNVELACFHGIGHGMVNADTNPALWGNEQAMVKPALKLCEQVSDNWERLYRCTSGVYNGIANFYMNREYKLQINPDNPVWLCHLQKEAYKESCYGNMMVAVSFLAKNDFIQAIAYVTAIADPLYIPAAVSYLAEGYALQHINDASYEPLIQTCYTLDSAVQRSCVTGLSLGLVEGGKPGKEYIKAMKICGNALVKTETKNSCYSRLIFYFSQIYPPQTFADVCARFETQYRKGYCS